MNLMSRRAIHFCLILILSAAYFLQGSAEIREMSPEKISAIGAKDAGHYLWILRSFSEHGPSMKYEKKLPHRQPLYPFLLWTGRFFGLELPQELLYINLTLMSLGIVLVYFLLLWATRSTLAAFTGALLWNYHPGLLEIATGTLLPEPLFCLLALPAIAAFYQTLTGRLRPLAGWILFSAFSSLAYQARVNGLFLYVSGLPLLFIWQLKSDKRRSREIFVLLLASLAVFALFSWPTLCQKALRQGNPFDHGYLSNYLWADDYRTAHDGMRHLRQHAYDFSYFAGRHDLWSAARRLFGGFYQLLTFKNEPLPVDKWELSRVFQNILLIAAFFPIILGKKQDRMLYVWMIIAWIPIAWTANSNPNQRVAYGQLLPFQILVSAVAVKQVLDKCNKSLFKGKCREIASHCSGA